MVPIIVALNYISVKVATFLNIPFFLDTWATSAGVMLGGVWVGLAGGVLYNFVMASSVWQGQYAWALVSAWVVVAVSFLFRKGWIDISRPGKLLGSGIMVGASTAALALGVQFMFYGGVDIYQPILPTFNALLEASGNKVLSAVAEKFITIPVDQIVSLFLAAIVYTSVSKRVKWLGRKN
jgi:hypothetical protein